MSSKIAKNSITYTVITLFGSALSVVINSLIAAKFGISYITDGFIIVLGFYQVIVVLFKTTLGTTFVPHFISIKDEHSEKEAWLFSSRVFNNIMGMSFLISVIFIIFSKYIAGFIALGYSDDPIAMAYIIKTFRLFLIFLFFGTLSALCISILIALGKIIYLSFYVIIQNLMPVLSVILFERYIGAYSLIYGYLFGSFVNFLIYFIILLRFRRYTFSFRVNDNFVKDYYRKVAPWFFSSLITKVSPVVEKIFATLSIVGGVMFIDFSQKLLAKSVGIFSMGVSLSSYSDISKHIAANDITKLNGTMSYSLKLILLFTVPIMLLVIFLREDIAVVLFKYGKMDYQDVSKIALVMVVHSLGIFLLNINDLLRKIIFSYKKLLFVSSLNVLQLIINTGIIVLFIKKLSYMSIPFAYSLTILIVFLSLVFYVRKIDKRIKIEGLAHFLLKLFSVSLIVLAFLYGSKFVIYLVLFENNNSLFNILFSLILSGVSFIFLSKVFKLEEITVIMSKIRIALKRVISNENQE